MLSNENWPHKRDDLISWHLFMYYNKMSMLYLEKFTLHPGWRYIRGPFKRDLVCTHEPSDKRGITLFGGVQILWLHFFLPLLTRLSQLNIRPLYKRLWLQCWTRYLRSRTTTTEGWWSRTPSRGESTTWESTWTAQRGVSRAILFRSLLKIILPQKR